MHFHLIEKGAGYVKMPGHGYLHVDYWDDWAKYRTQFPLSIVDQNGKEHHIGPVKFGQKGLLPSREVGEGKRVPNIPVEFEQLSEEFFSLGQGENYYESLELLGEVVRDEVLRALKDCAFDLTIFESNLQETVMTESLLREVSVSQVRNRFSRLAHGNAILTAFEFQYRFPLPRNSEGLPIPVPAPVLTFSVDPQSTPHTNVHVLIGRNGVGKTTCMQRFGSAVIRKDAADFVGQIENRGSNKDEWTFAGLVSISFSAFEDFMLPPPEKSAMRCTQVGLHNPNDLSAGGASLAQRLTTAFTESFAKCRSRPRSTRWASAVDALSSDPLFSEANIVSLLDVAENDPLNEIERKFARLSSGHKIVLLTITRLVELVDEATVVLLDEPEVHLHPPLLSAFIRALASLLLQRNGVALIATHSPVVLQEVPASCVWILHRSGMVSRAERPSIETFGENVGTLTREVFGLEVTDSGFYKLISQQAKNQALNFDAIVAHFGDQLGGEARAILKALISDRDKKK